MDICTTKVPRRRTSLKENDTWYVLSKTRPLIRKVRSGSGPTTMEPSKTFTIRSGTTFRSTVDLCFLTSSPCLSCSGLLCTFTTRDPVRTVVGESNRVSIERNHTHRHCTPPWRRGERSLIQEQSSLTLFFCLGLPFSFTLSLSSLSHSPLLLLVFLYGF